MAVGNRLKKAAGFHVVEADSTRIVLGLTGGTGAGKTSALDALRELGGKVMDCDAVYHEMLDNNEDMKNEINARFPGVFGKDGKLNRKKLGQEVFAKKERLAILDDIVFRFVVPELNRRLAAEGDGLYAIDAINLFESGSDKLCDRTIAITAPTELRVRRIMARDGIDEQYARLRISAQKPDDYYRGKCDYELNNNAESPEEFHKEALLFFSKLIEKLNDEKRRGADE